MSGKLSLDEVFSPVQLVIDCEIARYLTRLVKGLDFTEDQMEKSIGAIDRCAAKGHYFTDETTLSDHKRIYWAPTLFDHALFHTARGEVDIMERAKEVCATKIREHAYELGEDKKRKLEEIYAEATNNLA
jgi:trimethylamine:corrinoid methyltransferase-like protein